MLPRKLAEGSLEGYLLNFDADPRELELFIY
jgi:hypothetical protein